MVAAPFWLPGFGGTKKERCEGRCGVWGLPPNHDERRFSCSASNQRAKGTNMRSCILTGGSSGTKCLSTADPVISVRAAQAPDGLELNPTAASWPLQLGPGEKRMPPAGLCARPHRALHAVHGKRGKNTYCSSWLLPPPPALGKGRSSTAAAVPSAGHLPVPVPVPAWGSRGTALVFPDDLFLHTGLADRAVLTLEALRLEPPAARLLQAPK